MNVLLNRTSRMLRLEYDPILKYLLLIENPITIIIVVIIT